MANAPGDGTYDGEIARIIEQRIAYLNTKFKTTWNRKYHHRAEEAKWMKAQLRTLNASTSEAKNS